jgi:hypothetical protein
MMGVSAMKLESKRPAVPLAERGRMMFVKDVQELFGSDENGKPRKSRWWVLNSFAPNNRRKAGRDVYWWEKDVQEALDEENFS